MVKSPLPKWKLNLIKPGKFLDIGCQQGKLTDYVKDYFGLDYDETYRKEWESEGRVFIKADIRKELPIKDDEFDVVWASHIIEHILTQEQFNFVGECYRILNPGGYLIMFAPTPYHWYFWDHPTHQRPMTHGTLALLCKKHGFEVEEAKYSKLRWFPNKLQGILRLPPLRWFLWDTYVVVKKPKVNPPEIVKEYINRR